MSPLELKLGHFDLKSEFYILIFDMLVSANQDTKSTLEAKPRNEKFLPMNTDTLKPSCQVASNKKHHQDQYCLPGSCPGGQPPRPDPRPGPGQ